MTTQTKVAAALAEAKEGQLAFLRYSPASQNRSQIMVIALAPIGWKPVGRLNRFHAYGPVINNRRSPVFGYFSNMAAAMDAARSQTGGAWNDIRLADWKDITDE